MMVHVVLLTIVCCSFPSGFRSSLRAAEEGEHAHTHTLSYHVIFM